MEACLRHAATAWGCGEMASQRQGSTYLSPDVGGQPAPRVTIPPTLVPWHLFRSTFIGAHTPSLCHKPEKEKVLKRGESEAQDEIR